jgi:CheY-like chemotaxis protein
VYSVDVHNRSVSKTGPIRTESWIAQISRELRAPLTSVLGYAELLSDPSLDDATRGDFGEHVRVSGAKLLRCLEEFVEISVLQSPDFDPRIRESRAEDLIHKPLEIAQRCCEDKGVEFQSSIATEIPPRLRSDARLFVQALEELLGNAVHYTSAGTVRVDALWRGSSTDAGQKQGHGKVLFRIEDSGPGIPEELQAGLFHSFCEAAKRDDIPTGPGLGLAIAKASAEALGGSLELKHSDPSGSCFELSIPVEHPVQLGEEGGPAARRPKARNGGLRGRTILIADDSEGDRRLIEFVLSKQGAEVLSVCNGQEAVDRIEQEPRTYDLILMDMEMPVLDGLSAARKIREQGHDTPIVALTASALEEDRIACLAAGCNDFATKPVRQKDLKAMILEHCLGNRD